MVAYTKPSLEGYHPMIDRYVVMGNPIAHSSSPFIHTQFAQQTGQTLDYGKEWVAVGELDKALDKFKQAGGKGANITAPFKLAALEYVMKKEGNCAERAKRAGAVNTIKFQTEGGCLGDNTDGVGLIRDITQNLNWSIRNKKILMLGAGGAVRGVLEPILLEKPGKLIIANRTFEKAKMLATLFSDLGNVEACSFNELAGMQFGLVINGTAASLQDETFSLPQSLLTVDACCYDMSYGDKAEAFLQWAKTQGCKKYTDGVGMLVEQAAESFYIWRGVEPDTQPVISLLKRELRNLRTIT